MNEKKDLGFRIEMILMLVIFIGVILVLTRVFSLAELQSRRADHLTDAVILASNGAEVFRSAEDEEEICAILNENGNAVKEDKVRVYYNDELHPESSGSYCLEIGSEKEDGFINAEIAVYYQDELIYELNTGKTDEEGRQ